MVLLTPWGKLATGCLLSTLLPEPSQLHVYKSCLRPGETSFFEVPVFIYNYYMLDNVRSRVFEASGRVRGRC